MAEVALWQYRWLNPGNYPDQPLSMLEWKNVEAWNPRMQTVEQRVEELRSFRYDGKPAYEVRALGVIPDGVTVLQPSGNTPFPMNVYLRNAEELAAFIRQHAAGVTAVHPGDELGNFARWFVTEYGYAPDHREQGTVEQFKTWCAARNAGVGGRDGS